jgi:glycosyltransferase involved in cell wall biosynthesis
MNPRVTFLVPCYKLAHLLHECIESLLMQTYRDFEVLVMDDCSPDATPEVAASFGDARVRHVRHAVNLGHLRNYNRGVELARGEFIWLVSADDKLRRPYVLERFMTIMDARPDVGMVFCPGIDLFEDGREGNVNGSFGDADAIVDGKELLRVLAQYNPICTPAAMVRKDCYEKMGGFHLDLPYAADWYTWCFAALHHAVAYCGEPMVNYRFHDTNMTKALMKDAPGVPVRDVFTVRWRLKDTAEKIGAHTVAGFCTAAIVDDYVFRLTRKAMQNWALGLTPEQFEASLRDHARSEREHTDILALVYARVGDAHYEAGDRPHARDWYTRALSANPKDLRTRAKSALLSLGSPGMRGRQLISQLQRIDGARGATRKAAFAVQPQTVRTGTIHMEGLQALTQSNGSA